MRTLRNGDEEMDMPNQAPRRTTLTFFPQCDGESPCKRCRDDGLVCTAGHRKKAEFKQLPRGYAEVLENTQYALIATVHKLYAMVLAGEQWTLEPPVMNARGQPVIHDIAAKLGCIRADPSSSTSGGAIEFPADAEEFAALQRRLESEERAGSGEAGEMGGILSVTTGPESQFGDDSFCDDFDPGFEMEEEFDVDGGAGYGDVSPFSDGPGAFAMDGLQSLQQGAYEEFIPASSSSPAIPTAAVAGVQMQLPTQLQLTPQQQQQQQAALRAQQARQMQILQQQQQQQQQSLDFREQTQWGTPAAMEEQMRALMRGGMYAGPGMGMGGMGGDGTIRPNLLECGFGATGY